MNLFIANIKMLGKSKQHFLKFAKTENAKK
jgi:hypothetical protein